MKPKVTAAVVGGDNFCPVCRMTWLTPGVCSGGVVGNRYPKHAPVDVVGAPTVASVEVAVDRLLRERVL